MHRFDSAGANPPAREVVADDAHVRVVVRHEPPAHGLRREETVGERAHEPAARAHDTRDFAEHRDRIGEVVDRDATRRVIEGVGRERERRIRVQVVHDPRRRLRVRGELLCIETEDGEVGGRVSEVRHPRAHEVEDVALHIEFVVERADRRDRGVVDVGDEPRERVELGVLLLVLAGEEPGRVLAHCGCSMSSSTSPSGPAKQTKRRTGRSGPIAIATGGEIVSTPSAASCAHE